MELVAEGQPIENWLRERGVLGQPAAQPEEEVPDLEIPAMREEDRPSPGLADAIDMMEPHQWGEDDEVAEGPLMIGISSEAMDLVEKWAAREGRTPGEILEDAVRLYVERTQLGPQADANPWESGTFRGLVGRLRARQARKGGIPEDEVRRRLGLLEEGEPGAQPGEAGTIEDVSGRPAAFGRRERVGG